MRVRPKRAAALLGAAAMIILAGACGTGAPQSPAVSSHVPGATVGASATGAESAPPLQTLTPSLTPTAMPGVSPTPGLPETSPGEPAAWEWADEDGIEPDPSQDVPPQVALPEGEELPAGGDAAAPQEVGLDTPTDLIDVCALITDAEWASYWDDALVVEAILLEKNEACGWERADSFVRMAVAVLPRSPEQPWLLPDDEAAATVIEGVGDRALWMEHRPLAQTSTLVVESAGRDVIVEMAARDGTTSEVLLEAALHFAGLILGRLP